MKHMAAVLAALGAVMVMAETSVADGRLALRPVELAYTAEDCWFAGVTGTPTATGDPRRSPSSWCARATGATR
jgi:hypothetical protein